MKFEWDERKNKTNIRKHGISFKDVIEVFDYPMVVALDDSVEYGESRWMGIGVMQPHIIVVVYTERIDDVIRIISARKANKREVGYYAENI